MALTKLKAFADDKFSVSKRRISVSDRVENIVEKGENAGYQHFLLFPQCFQKLAVSRLLKHRIVWLRVNLLLHDKILQLSKLKAFADDKVNMAPKLKLIQGKDENIVAIGGNGTA